MIFRTVVADSLMITGFVTVMMLLVEYAQVASAGLLGRWLRKGGALRSGAVTLVGTAPGCLGAFTGVTLYTHGLISFGTFAGAMIASSGDEAFVMLALFPKRAVLLFGVLFAYGLLVALAVDRLTKPRFYRGSGCPDGIVLHPEEASERPGPLRLPSPAELTGSRIALVVSLAFFVLAVGLGWIGPERWTWVRWTLLAVSCAALCITVASPAHFFEEHLYRHVARRHAPRVFLWVCGVLAALAWLRASDLPVGEWIQGHPLAALGAALLLGIIPESGPHMVFAALFAQGVLPFSVLAASSVVQDGHGMLPLLAESPREFLKVKGLNVLAGGALGGGLMALGF